MNKFDHSDYRDYINRQDEARRQESAAWQESLRRKLPEPEAAPDNSPWQAGFLFRFFFQLAFWSWLIWWLLDSPKLPIRWLQ